MTGNTLVGVQELKKLDGCDEKTEADLDSLVEECPGIGGSRFRRWKQKHASREKTRQSIHTRVLPRGQYLLPFCPVPRPLRSTRGPASKDPNSQFEDSFMVELTVVTKTSMN